MVTTRVVETKTIRERLVNDYKMPEGIAEDCAWVRSDEDVQKFISSLDRYGPMLTMPFQRYGKRK